MRTEVRNQIAMLGNAVATEVAGSSTHRRWISTHRRWIRLGPVEDQIALIEVEVPVEADPTDWPKTDDEYVIVAQDSFDSLDAALDSLHQRGIDTDSFDAIWKSENPF